MLPSLQSWALQEALLAFWHKLLNGVWELDFYSTEKIWNTKSSNVCNLLSKYENLMGSLWTSCPNNETTWVRWRKLLFFPSNHRCHSSLKAHPVLRGWSVWQCSLDCSSPSQICFPKCISRYSGFKLIHLKPFIWALLSSLLTIGVTRG